MTINVYQAQRALRQSRGRDIQPGEATELFNGLDAASKAEVAARHDVLATQRELGRHGRPELATQGLDRETVKDLHHFAGAIEMDAVALGVQQRMGTDASLPVPPPTSRDFVEAAFNHHSGA